MNFPPLGCGWSLSSRWTVEASCLCTSHSLQAHTCFCWTQPLDRESCCFFKSCWTVPKKLMALQACCCLLVGHLLGVTLLSRPAAVKHESAHMLCWINLRNLELFFSARLRVLSFQFRIIFSSLFFL
ncbi:hypothetical protein VIGAN_UM153000 [Vigna angularis var. angularis]|uniref:Uncharacterized protein n=1 Tax=Vigna angularis var. angularis TaxID=157739 RepID=A0A0S3TDQ3_PHAAN|nr:hypothetical protein VIGAN_UM057800 [Vigna angularis var. angularis]BAU03464.1 hypothetical protein VIGAN_UM110700 [Vigna angularis var. angularis]BAU03662.1 hypothetical protein VIGAN_UM153000 [Vigna angularis var. angularis]